MQAPDASNTADFLRISPWQTYSVHDALREYQVERLLAEAERVVVPQVIYIINNIDDLLGEKDKATCHIQAADWHYDHSESSKSKPRYKNAFCYLVCTMRVGKQTASVGSRCQTRHRLTNTVSLHFSDYKVWSELFPAM
ncbi:MAG: hypothetical protein GY796_05720 [Chloroflexi bacterium]|nr:hypothetical protein [Chloroflexota bacterium]